jgi:DNA repair ATPase RecN
MSTQPPTEPSDPRETRPVGRSTRQEDQDRTLDALHRLERATGAAAGRPTRWHQHALAALVALDETTADEQRHANQPDSLLSDIARTHPRLRNRVRAIRTQYTHIRETITSFRHEMAHSDTDATDISDLRRRTEHLASALRYQRSRESDLIYEAYFDTFNTELEPDQNSSP